MRHFTTAAPHRGAPVSFLMLLGFLTVTYGIGITSTAFLLPVTYEWYETLVKPQDAPPQSLFGPVGGILYTLIAVSGWLVWKEAGFQLHPYAWSAYAAQLVFNMIWTPLFFGLHAIDWTLADGVFLLFAIAINLYLFHPLHPLAATLLMPHLFWAGYAAYLNAMILKLNGA